MNSIIPVTSVRSHYRPSTLMRYDRPEGGVRTVLLVDTDHTTATILELLPYKSAEIRLAALGAEYGGEAVLMQTVPLKRLSRFPYKEQTPEWVGTLMWSLLARYCCRQDAAGAGKTGLIRDIRYDYDFRDTGPDNEMIEGRWIVEIKSKMDGDKEGDLVPLQDVLFVDPQTATLVRLN